MEGLQLASIFRVSNIIQVLITVRVLMSILMSKIYSGLELLPTFWVSSQNLFHRKSPNILSLLIWISALSSQICLMKLMRSRS